MGAPLGNQFWKLREKNGRNKIFTSPEELWEQATEYFEYCDANPLVEIEWNGKDPIECELPKMRAYTWSGLELYLDIDSLRWYKTAETHKEYLQVISRIEKILYTQKFEGAAAGMLNQNIIARDLGLVDKKEFEGNVVVNSELLTSIQEKINNAAS